jgi:hypothetical protein
MLPTEIERATEEAYLRGYEDGKMESKMDYNGGYHDGQMAALEAFRQLSLDFVEGLTGEPDE